jgi:porin
MEDHPEAAHARPHRRRIPGSSGGPAGGRWIAGWVFLALLSIGPGPGLAETIDPPWWSREELTGDWRGARSRLAERGLEFDVVYTGETFFNRSGGISRGAEYLDNTDFIVSIDAEKALGWSRTNFLIYALRTNGGNPSDRIGDLQGVSNIAAPDTWKFFELWAEASFRPQFSLLAGLYDLNSEFDVIDSAELFLNSSHGIGIDFSQSGLNGPSIFPTTSLGLRAKYHPTLHFYLQGAVLDGVPGDPNDPEGTQIILDEQDGLLVALEASWLLGPAEELPLDARRLRLRRIGRLRDWRYRAKFAVGLWGYTEAQQEILQPDPTASQRSRSWGTYLLAEDHVYREAGDPQQGLEVFGRFGVAASEVNRIGSYTGAGVVYTGLFPGRPEDQIGLAIAAAHNGEEFKTSQRLMGLPVDNAEIAVELTYLVEVFPWLTVQPDLQYIINPGTDPDIDNALATGLRITISL